MSSRNHAIKVAAVLAAVAFPSVAYTYPDAPHIFGAGDPIVADEMNDNFQHMVDGLSNVERGVVPIGTVVAWAGTTVPDGWLLCDGAEHQIAEYPDLAPVVGSLHGGDGATVFNVPDLRGRFIRGVDGGEGRDPDALSRTQPQTGSGSSGDAVGSVQADSFAAHSHGTAINFPNNIPGPGPFGAGSYGAVPEVMYAASHGPGDAQNSEEVGGNENRPVNVYLHFIIRAE